MELIKISKKNLKKLLQECHSIYKYYDHTKMYEKYTQIIKTSSFYFKNEFGTRALVYTYVGINKTNKQNEYIAIVELDYCGLCNNFNVQKW